MTVFGMASAQLSRAGGRKALFGAAFRLELRHFYIFLSSSTWPAPRAMNIGGWACLWPRHLMEGAVCSHSAMKLQASGNLAALFIEPVTRKFFSGLLGT